MRAYNEGWEGGTHYLTLPLERRLIEWEEPSPLEPQLGMPPLGAGAFEQLGEQMQRMIHGMQRGTELG